jgi:hypothetical protein
MTPATLADIAPDATGGLAAIPCVKRLEDRVPWRHEEVAPAQSRLLLPLGSARVLSRDAIGIGTTVFLVHARHLRSVRLVITWQIAEESERFGKAQTLGHSDLAGMLRRNGAGSMSNRARLASAGTRRRGPLLRYAVTGSPVVLPGLSGGTDGPRPGAGHLDVGLTCHGRYSVTGNRSATT